MAGEDNVAVVRAIYDEASGDLAGVLADEAATAGLRERLEPFFHPDFAFEWQGALAGVAGFAGVFHGLDAYTQRWVDWFSAWETFRFELRELVAVDADRVLAVATNRGRSAEAGVEISVDGGAIWTLREGRVEHVALFTDAGEAREAAGLTRS